MQLNMGVKIQIAVFASLVLVCCAPAQPISEEKMQLLDIFIESLMECLHFGPGVTIVMVNDNEIVYNKTYGVADIETQEELTLDHRFCIASVTKSFTSTLLAALLTEKPEFSFSSRIKDILGDDFKLHDELRTEHTLLQDLLAHRMGSQRFDGPKRVGEFIEMSRGELMSRMQYLTEVVPFRTEFSYNNYYYTLAGLAAETVDGSTKSYEELVKENLLDPLGMDSAVWMSPYLDEEEWNTIAKPHAFTLDGSFAKLDKVVVEIIHPTEPAGGLCIKPTDMAAWMNFHLGNGTNPYGDEQLVSPALFAQLHNEQQQYNWFVGQPLIPVTITTVGYCLGFYSGTYRGFRALYHDGALTGYNAEMLILPDVNAGVFVSNNGPTDTSNVIGLQLAVFFASDLLLGLEPWLDNTTACSFPKMWNEALQEMGKNQHFGETLPLASHETKVVKKNNNVRPDSKARRTAARPLENYVGDYRHYFGGVVHITYNATIEALHFEMGLGKGYLEPHDTEPDAFLLNFYGHFWHFTDSTLKSDDMLYFQEDEDNPEEITSVEIPWMSPDVYPVFVKNLPDPTDVPTPTTPTCPGSATLPTSACMPSFLLALLALHLFLLKEII